MRKHGSWLIASLKAFGRDVRREIGGGLINRFVALFLIYTVTLSTSVAAGATAMNGGRDNSASRFSIGAPMAPLDRATHAPGGEIGRPDIPARSNAAPAHAAPQLTPVLTASAAQPADGRSASVQLAAQAQVSQPAAACLYALDSSAQQAFYVSGSTSMSTSCSAVVESSASQAFYMSGTETIDLQSNAQVGVVGGYLLSGQTSLVNTSTGQKVSPVSISSPGDPFAFLPVPTQGTIVKTSHTSYDMNNKPPNNTLAPGVYCGGLTIGNTNGATFTMSPGTYIMAGGGLTVNSLGIISGSGITVYNTSSTGWGCSGSSSYSPITITGQANVTLTAPSSGALAGVIFFGDRAGCSTLGSCQDQINSGSITKLNGAMYFKSDTFVVSGTASNTGCMTVAADKININGNSPFSVTGCTGTVGGVTVTVSPTAATLSGGQSQQFSATVANASNTAVTWSLSGAGTINSSGLYTSPANVTSQQTVTITATSQAESTVSASATVTLLPPVSVSTTPLTASLYNSQTQQFSASVSNTGNTAVIWSISPSGSGTISASGLYTAPATINSQQTVKVTATSVANTSASASATVTLVPPVSVSVTPTGAAINPGQTQQFTASVANTTNTAVTWSINPSGTGSISSSGLYTAPASITKQQTITVTATSQADTTKSASATVTVNVPLPVITSIAPSSAPPGSQVTITGQNFLATAATATLNGVTVPTTSWSNTSITFNVPTNNCTGPVTVTTQYGTSNAVTLTISGTQVGCMYPAPVANAGPGQTVSIGSNVQLDGTASTDQTGNPLTYSWSLASVPSGSSASITSPASPKPTFVADVYGNYAAQLIVNDGYHNSTPSQVVITTKDSAPVANAGPNQTVPTHTLAQLNGSASTEVDGNSLAYAWSFASVPVGSQAVLSNPTSVNPTFTTDKTGTYVVQLVVNDGILNSAPATVTISDVNTPPVANAGPSQTVEIDTTVQLNGSGSSDVDGDALTYRWSILSAPAGSQAALSNSSIVNPTFVADVPGNFVVQLIVNDGTVDGAPSTVTIGNQDIAPVANAGAAQKVGVGALVSLDGTGSTDSDNKSLTYLWSILSTPAQSQAMLTSTTAPNPALTADKYGNYVVQLIVNDGYLSSLPSTVTISTVYTSPVANPGSTLSVTTGTAVNLSGAASTSNDGYSLTYQWSMLSTPAGSTAALSNPATVTPSFIADVPGAYVVQLIVNDTVSNSTPQPVMITAFRPNQPPVVNAGPDQAAYYPSEVALSGTATDDGLPAGSTLTIQWSMISGPGNAIFANPGSAATTVTFDQPGTYVLQLSANDTQLTSTSTCKITYLPTPVIPPVANGGANQTVFVGSAVQLDGTGSSNSYGASLTYLWSFVSAPTGTGATLSSATSPKPTFFVDKPGAYTLQLIVYDGRSMSAPSQVVVSTKNLPPVAKAGMNQTVPTHNLVRLDGSGSTDVDGDMLTYTWSFVSQPVNSQAVLTNPNSVNPTFTTDEKGTYVVQLIVNDGQADSTPSIVTISDVNTAPVANAGVGQSVQLGSTVQLNGSGSTDVDGDSLTYRWSILSAPTESTATLSSATIVNPIFLADVPGNFVVQLIVNDGTVDSVSATVTISTHDTPPAANAGAAQTVAVGAPVSLDGTTSADSDGQVLTYLWSILSAPNGSLAALSSATAPTPTFTTDVYGDYVVQLIVNDGYLSSLPSTVVISTIYTPPVANPGPALNVLAGTTVNLTGAASTSNDGHALTYKWAMLSAPTGSAAMLSSTTVVNPSFIADIPGAYVVQLIVNDGVSDSAPKTVMITAVAALVNQPPQVSAGPAQEVFLTYPATLNGTVTDDGLPLGAQLSILWKQVANPDNDYGLSKTIVLNHNKVPNTDQQDFPVLISGTYPFLANVASGGKVYSSNGWDIFFSSDNAGQNRLDHEIDTYDPASGTVNFWVRIPNLSHIADTTIYMWYGNSAVTASQENAAGVWKNGYVEVWHFNNLNGSLGTQGTGSGSTPPVAKSGFLGTSGLSLTAANGNTVTMNSPVNASSTMTMQAWLKPASTTNYGWILSNLTNDSYPGYSMRLDYAPGDQRFVAFEGSASGQSWQATGDTINPGSWTQLAHTIDGATNATYFNGKPVSYAYNSGPAQPVGSSTTNLVVGNIPGYGYFYDGLIDELRISSVVRSPDWIATEYNNQSSPSIFYSVFDSIGGNVSFTDPASPVTQATFSSPGKYRLQLSANDTQYTTTSEVTVTVLPIPTNQPPSVNAGPNQTISWPNSVMLAGSASDDGLPFGSTLTSQWAVLTGPGHAIFGNSNSATTTVIFDQPGTYVLQLSASDTQLTSTSTCTITDLAGPVVSAGPDQTITLPSGAQLAGTVLSPGSSPGFNPTILWSKLSGPGTVTFGDSTKAQTSASFDSTGVYILNLSANDGHFTASSTVQITVVAPSVSPLVANAGNEVTILWPTNTATLSGMVTRDGIAVPANSQWTLLNGPAAPTFDDATSLTPTLTFSKPGAYTLQLTASNSGQTATSTVLVYVGHLSCARSNKGTDYWIAVPQSYISDLATTVLSLYVSGDVATTGTVTVAGLGYTAPFTVTPGQTTTVTLPIGAKILTNDTVENKGIHIVSNDPVVAYLLDYVPAATDGYTALPTNMLGTDYMALSFPSVSSRYPYPDVTGSEFVVTATADNTTVTVTPSVPTDTHDGRVAYSITLNQGQTYQLRNNYGPGAHPTDLTGTVVHSDKPIAFFSGHDCDYVPGGGIACNHLIEEIPPTQQWGANFAVAPLAGRSSSLMRVVASQDDTTVKINGTVAATLRAGGAFDQIINAASFVSTDKPAAVVLFGESMENATVEWMNDSPMGDPAMIFVPPIEHFGGSVTVETPATGFQSNYISVVAPTSAGSLTLDGVSVSTSMLTPIADSGFSAGSMPVGAGAHTLKADFPFLTTVYGYAPYDAYGYVGSICLAESTSGTTLQLSPRTASAPVTSQQCVSATAADGSGNPVGGAGVTFKTSGVNNASSLVATDASGKAQFCYTGMNAGSDLVTADIIDAQATATITWGSKGPNQPPIVNAGAAQTIVQPQSSILLSGVATDDGLPVGSTLQIQWTEVSGPAAVTFATPTQAATIATFPAVGSYVLSLSASDGELSASSSVTVTVYAPNQPPVVTVGPAVSTYVGSWVYLTGQATDDGLPLGSTLQTSWGVVTGPGNFTIGGTDATTVWGYFRTAGNYQIGLTASDGQYKVTKTIPVTVNPTLPAASCGVNPNPGNYIPTVVLLNSTIPITAYPMAGSGPVDSVFWQTYGNPLVIADPNAMSTTVSFPQLGTYFVEGICSNAFGGGGARAYFQVEAQAAPPPQVSISLPDGSDITKPSAITGNVTSGTYQLSYAPVGSNSFVSFAAGSGPIVNGSLGTLDPTLMLNGTYTIRLTSSDAQNQTATVDSTVTVRGNQKLGVLTFSLSDLSVPLPGLPLQIVRTYDSRTRGTVGDFGNGWNLSIASARLQKSLSLGSGWYEDSQYVGQFPQYCLQPTKSHNVTVTFPDGTLYKFLLGATPQCQGYAPILAPTISFTQVSTGSATAGATLEVVGDTSAIVAGSVPGEVELDGYDSNPVNPTVFRLTTATGYVYIIDEKLGVTHVTDPNGNQLTINVNGVTHSNGESVTFVRDSSNRITTISDTSGNQVLYTYNDAGDLIQVVDRTQNAINLTYDTTHYLSAMVDQKTNTPLLATSHDGNTGRLTAIGDGTVQPKLFSYDPTGQTQTVTDSTGATTTYTYDDDGNITQVVDALGNVSSSTYDANDNKLSDTDKLGRATSYTYDSLGDRLTETNPLNQTTTYTYDAHKRVLSVTDALGNLTSNTYDGQGNLLQTTDPSGKNTAYQYYAGGQPQTVTDPTGAATSFEYDSQGNLSKQTDALGNVTRYTYDASNNKLSQTITRTMGDGSKQALTTGYAYDAQGRLTATTYPDGTTSSTVYDSMGHRVSSTDQSGVVTHFAYDNNGRLIETDYADGSNARTSYDNEGRVTGRWDRTGAQTSYAIDVLGRTTRVTPPFSYGSATAYDAAGQVTSVTDEAGKVTSYTYDGAGRRLTTTDALQHTTTSAYDAGGQLISVKDARGNTTKYKYDANGRQTSVIYPDNSSSSTAYDDAGRMTAKIDQAGLTTLYGYDAIGRLTSVTDALGQVTSYTYDEAGNRLTQTDANLHRTSFAYDSMGRRSKRTLPAGQSESVTYDAAGRLATRTDFNGRTTTYQYDSNGWLLSKTPDAFFNAVPVTYTYYPDGKRRTMTDATGTTTYQFDARRRITQKATPFGTINYGWQYYGPDLGGISTSSGNVNTVYGYDDLHRITTARGWYGGQVNYTYDEVGNLSGTITDTGVATTYNYDGLNRLTALGAQSPSGPVASYAYTLGAAGNRTAVTELNGRTVAYTYDNLYRLTSETIAHDPSAMNGVVGYQYDSVGNRKQLTSTLAAIPATGVQNYDANDRFTGFGAPTYDNNGNIVSAGIADSYDFENHLIQHGYMTFAYDGDGNRVSKTMAGVTTNYLVDDQASPTGYADVLEEITAGWTTVAYTYGPMRAFAGYPQQNLPAHGFPGWYNMPIAYFGYDGHGSVRYLTDRLGQVTQTYDYDAFGNVINQTSTPSQWPGVNGLPLTIPSNTMMFAGEQFDPDLNLYYNRARYLDTRAGRFWGMDDDEGDDQAPLSLHKYLYAQANPVNDIDPSGADTQDAIYGREVHRVIGQEFEQTAGLGYSNRTINTILAPQSIPILGRLRPDLVDTISYEVYEIKPVTDVVEGIAQVTAYIAILRTFDKQQRGWQYGFTYTPKQNPIKLGPGVYAMIFPTFDGVISYKVVNLKALAGEAIAAGIVGISIEVSSAIMLGTMSPATI